MSDRVALAGIVLREFPRGMLEVFVRLSSHKSQDGKVLARKMELSEGRASVGNFP